MSPVEVSCPACGAPITFRIGSSVVAVCEFCKSAVARGDKNLEDLGKVADLVETGSPLDVGLKGAYHGVGFELTGRAQLGHEAGGMWDEWYAAFSDGRWGWLAEAQGRFYLTFQIPMETPQLPSLENLELGQPVAALPGSVPLMVAEKGEARALGARGEIPYRLTPGDTYYYADLSGPHGEFATLDYSGSPPVVFIGREVSLNDLGLAGATAPEREARHVAGVQLNCPKCGGPLDLRAPDQTERVTCPNCSSLLDVNQGKLTFLNTLKPGKVVPVIPLGATGEILGGKYTAIGFMQRSVEIEGTRYYWEEYLLYNPQIGFRWLVHSDGQWDFVEPVPPGAVQPSNKYASFNGQQFRMYQDEMARVEYVSGEFYWKVTQGETVRAIDYVHPPQMLSLEMSVNAAHPGRKQTPEQIAAHKRSVETGEINWSLGTYVDTRTVERAFGIGKLPAAAKPAPNQVFPHKKIYKYWGLLTLATFLLWLVIAISAPDQKIFQQTFSLQPLPNATSTQTVFTDPIELHGNRNIQVTASAPVSNSWLYVDGDFYNDKTGLDQSFELPVEYYFGSDSDGSWSEGSTTNSVHISALPADKYVLRLEVSWGDNYQAPASVGVTVEQGVARGTHLLFTLLALSVIPVIVMIKHFNFSRRRWADSKFSPFQSS
ncbi:MAG TPA: DUF4178 domain-containing protein [Blastocatellia bacterium]|nr:DUF4178 domain-containing protein [Blastocatellia bacterium]